MSATLCIVAIICAVQHPVKWGSPDTFAAFVLKDRSSRSGLMANSRFARLSYGFYRFDAAECGFGD